MRKEEGSEAEPKRKFFESHAPYFGYKCDQPPFWTRIVVERHEKEAILENKNKMFVVWRM